MVPLFHGARQNGGTHFAQPYDAGWAVRRKPDMRTLPRARSFQVGGNGPLRANLQKCRNVIRPSSFVEIYGQKPASLIFEEGIYSSGQLFRSDDRG